MVDGDRDVVGVAGAAAGGAEGDAEDLGAVALVVDGDAFHSESDLAVTPIEESEKR